ncbi:hypothetical protein J7E98_13930 [Streptomyces sp. ISL-86]|nr:hypothetical protein [Streptomyces sp. ISL-86]
MAQRVAEKLEPSGPTAQHNHGAGIFIAGDVFGDVHNNAPPQKRSTEEGPAASGVGDHEDDGPFAALVGYTMLIVMLIGSASYGMGASFLPGLPIGQRIVGVLVGVTFAFGGVVALAFWFATLAEVCATGAANTAGFARDSWAQNRTRAATVNLRLAAVLARATHCAAVPAGFIAALVGFLPVAKRGADRANVALRDAETEVAETRGVLGGHANTT